METNPAPAPPSMIRINPDYLSIGAKLAQRGIPDHRSRPEDYPLEWSVEVRATVFDDELVDGIEYDVGSALVYTVPDSGLIPLFNTLDAVDQELADVGELLSLRPDLLEDSGLVLGGDLMVLSALEIKPQFRGHGLGYAALKTILATIGRNTGLVMLQAAPFLDEGQEEGTPEYLAAMAALRRYWAGFGFVTADDRHLAYFVGN